jgi:hypothetical protein
MIAAAPLFRYSSPMTGKRLRAVIFDYGEVLSLPQDAEARVRLQALSGLPGELFRREYRRCRPPFDRGELSGAAYWTRVLGAGNGTVDPALIPSLLRVDAESWSRVNPAVLAWSRSLREAGYRRPGAGDQGRALPLRGGDAPRPGRTLRPARSGAGRR